MRHSISGIWLALGLFFATLSSGCVAAGKGIAYGMSDKGPTHAQKVLLDEELAPYRGRGESAITGRVFLQTPNGEVVGARRSVHLTPAVEYIQELVQSQVIDRNKMIDRKAEDVWWTTRADQDGRFVFSWLPAGSYVALVDMAWSPRGGTDAQEAIAYGLVRVKEREHVDIVVTRKVGD